MKKKTADIKKIACKDCRNRKTTGLCTATDKYVPRRKGAAKCEFFKVKK